MTFKIHDYVIREAQKCNFKAGLCKIIRTKHLDRLSNIFTGEWLEYIISNDLNISWAV